MSNMARESSFAFSAGVLGGLANSVAVWFFGHIGLTGYLGVKIAPALTKTMLYPRLIWGGIWGLVFLFGIPRGGPVKKGLILGLLPAGVQLLYIFPQVANKGYFGLELGYLTPAFVIIYNAIWGLVAAMWLSMCNQR